MIYICTLLASASGRVGGISDAVVGNGENLRLTFPLPVEGVTVRLCVSHGKWYCMHQSVQHLQTLLYMIGCLRLVLAVMTFS